MALIRPVEKKLARRRLVLAITTSADGQLPGGLIVVTARLGFRADYRRYRLQLAPIPVIRVAFL